MDKNKKNTILSLFCSLKLTITLLILLAVVSIFGTVIPQRLSNREYMKHYTPDVYHLMKVLGVFDLYHTWWFQLLLVLLIINLIVCSLDRFPRAWKFISRPKKWLNLNEVESYPLRNSLEINARKFSPSLAGEKVKEVLKNAKVSSRRETTVFFAEKGKISRLGVYITHLSVIIIILGALLGSLFGFEAFVSLLEGTSTNTVFLRDGKNTPKKLNFTIRCDKFKISLYPNGMIKAYTSYISILKKGKAVIKSRKVLVNHPLMFEGIRLYQSSYERERSPLMIIGVMDRGEVGETDYSLMGGVEKRLSDGTTFSIVRYHPNLQGYGPAVQIMERSPNGTSKTFWIFLNYPMYDMKRGGKHIFILKDVRAIYSTGLQVTKDPGVGVVWLGCLMMVGGLFVTFFITHKRIWVILHSEGKNIGITIVGSTNRNLITFEKEFQKLTNHLREKLREKPIPLQEQRG